MDQDTNNRKAYTIWIINTLLLTIIAFLVIALLTIYIDPLFHYHAPLKNYGYLLYDQRYQNDGISRNFEYDSIIAGTSMVENFKKTEADSIFDANFIKVPFSGANYKEINDNLQRAYEAGKNIRYVIRCLDLNYLVADKNAYKTNAEYPSYLYNDNPFDDINYVLNKSILFTQTLNIIKTKNNESNTAAINFDDYSWWSSVFTYGKEIVLSTYTLGNKAEVFPTLSEDGKKMILENIQQNVTDLADAHPETTFYLFFSPYSICYWDRLNTQGQINWMIDAEQVAIEEILKHPNIKLYSFCNNFDLICNLDNYRDVAHYGGWVNSQILEWLYEDEYLLTKDNYQAYLKETREFYNSYDYESLWK